MRKLGAFLFAAAVLVGGACGADEKAPSAAIDNASDIADQANDATSKIAANSVFADTCGGREAINIGTAFASAMGSSSAVDYDDVAAALRKAADAAPAEIRDDFRVVADAEAPFLKVLAEAKGDYMALAQNSEYQQAIAALDTDAFRQASETISSWFEEHCK